MSAHDKAIEAAWRAWHDSYETGASEGDNLRRAIAAFLRVEAMDIEPSDTGPYSTYWHSVKDFLTARADELDGGGA